MIKEKDYVTTGDVAKEFGVCIHTVAIWVKQKKLNAFVTPGGHRRIPKEEYQEFKKKYLVNY